MTKRLLFLGLVLATLSACSDEPLSRTGTDVDPVTLTAAWGQGPTGIGGDVLGFLIDGTGDTAVRVVEGDPPRAVDTAEERHGVEALLSDKGDITVVRAGVLQMLGADSLAPLGAPFVVTNNDQADAIAADTELSEQLMSGLDELGLVGLGLVPGGLRHPFGYGTEALVGADDYRDQAINVREDAGAEAMLTQLGARADHSVDSERVNAAGKTLRGIEVSVQQVGAVTVPAVQTPNVTFYEKFDVGVVRKGVWDGLSAAQREDLLDSFGDAARAATETRVTEEEGQEAWCTTPNASSVLATEAELASLHEALDPITEQLSDQPAFAKSLDRMRELGAGTVDPSPSACDAEEQPDAAAAYYVTPRGDQSVLDGLWRIDVDGQALMDGGISREDALNNAGVWEFRIKDGYADGVQPDGRPCNGQFAVDGKQVSVDWGVDGLDSCSGLSRGTYELRGDKLFFDWEKEYEFDVLLDQLFFAGGMVRIE